MLITHLPHSHCVLPDRINTMHSHSFFKFSCVIIWTASSEFGTYSLCEQRRFRRACASAQSRQNLRCSPIQAVSQEEHWDRKPDPWPLWMAGHAQLKFVMTECLKTQIRLTQLICKTMQLARSRLSSSSSPSSPSHQHKCSLWIKSSLMSMKQIKLQKKFLIHVQVVVETQVMVWGIGSTIYTKFADIDVVRTCCKSATDV